jgi:hypothetical protein
MTDTYVITDMFTGKDVKLSPWYPDEPSVWFIEGWNAGMEFVQAYNPYLPGTSAWLDWQEGYDLAQGN